ERAECAVLSSGLARKAKSRKRGQRVSERTKVASALQSVGNDIADLPPDGAVKLPWCKFYPRDWLGDVALRSLGYAARGLWADLLSIMAMSEKRGFLIVAGQPLKKAEDIARITSSGKREVKQLLNQLEAAKMFARDDKGVIFSRRLVRDTETSSRKRLAGLQ